MKSMLAITKNYDYLVNYFVIIQTTLMAFAEKHSNLI